MRRKALLVFEMFFLCVNLFVLAEWCARWPKKHISKRQK